MKQTFKEAGYSYIEYLGNGEHLLKDNSSGNLEVFFANKNHASWGLKYKNTHLEFARSWPLKPMSADHTRRLTETNSDR